MVGMYVYAMRSLQFPARYYSGLTDDPDHRLDEHNLGFSRSTRGYRPWRLVVSLEFTNPEAARIFEQYLKSGSGRAFSKRHFW